MSVLWRCCNSWRSTQPPCTRFCVEWATNAAHAVMALHEIVLELGERSWLHCFALDAESECCWLEHHATLSCSSPVSFCVSDTSESYAVMPETRTGCFFDSHCSSSCRTAVLIVVDSVLLLLRLLATYEWFVVVVMYSVLLLLRLCSTYEWFAGTDTRRHVQCVVVAQAMFNVWVICTGCHGQCVVVAQAVFNVWVICSCCHVQCVVVAHSMFNVWVICTGCHGQCVVVAQAMFNVWVICICCHGQCVVVAHSMFNVWVICWHRYSLSCTVCCCCSGYVQRMSDLYWLSWTVCCCCSSYVQRMSDL